MNEEVEAGFWPEWDSQEEQNPRRRGGRRWARSERGQRWRQHFHDYVGTFPEEHWLFSGRRFRPWHHGRADFNPFVANLMSMGGGLLPVMVLKLIAEEPRYGNEITTLIRERTGGHWMGNPGAIYPLLTQLEEEGLVEGEWEDARKRTMRIYRLTPLGEQELDHLTAIIRPKLLEAVTVLQNLNQGLDKPA